MIKKFGYYIFAAFFSLFRLCPLNKDKVFLVATHDDGPEGNIGLMVEYIKKERAGIQQSQGSSVVAWNRNYQKVWSGCGSSRGEETG